MQLHETNFRGAPAVDGYGPGYFRISGEIKEGAVLVAPFGIIRWGGFDDPEPLIALSGTVDVLFIGTGLHIIRIPMELNQALEQARIGVEAMSSPSACRTYNVVLSEGRRVALAALPV